MEQALKTELTITRILDAPRELVFKAFTDPVQLQQWWGPKGFTAPVCKAEARKGGDIYIDMKGPDGMIYPMDGEFVEVKEPERLVFIAAALDVEGKRLFENLNTLTFEEQGDKTRLTLRVSVNKMRGEAEQYIAGMEEGWKQSLDKLGAQVTDADKKMILISRIFDAPREVVFKAWSSAEQLKKWYAPAGCSISYITVDFKVGGLFHHCLATPGGDCWCKGVYTEIITPEKIVYKLGFSDPQGNSVDDSPVGKDPDWPLETRVEVTFTEQDGKTKVTLYQTALESVGRRTGAYTSWLSMLDILVEDLAKA